MSKLEELLRELCPNGVEYKCIGEIANCYPGATPKTSKPEYWENGTIPWMSSGEVNYGEVTFTGKKITQLGYDNSSTKMVPANTVVIALAGQGKTRGTVAITRIPLCTNQSLCAIVTKENILSEFLLYFLRSQYQQLRDVSSGDGTRGGLNLKMINAYKVPVPPLPVQSEIVRILDNFTELTAELTAKLTAELTSRKKQYEYYREQSITSSTNCIVKLSEIVDIYLGLTATPTYTDEGVTFISAQNTSSDYLDLSNVKYISREDFEKATSNAKPKRGDVLFTRVGSNLGHPVIVETDEELCIFVSLGYLRVKNNAVVLNSFLKHWMNTDLFWSQIRKNVHGAAKVNLNTGWLKDFDIILPPIEQQLKIIDILDKFDDLCNAITKSICAEIEARTKQYEYYRDKLLTFKELS